MRAGAFSLWRVPTRGLQVVNIDAFTAALLSCREQKISSNVNPQDRAPQAAECGKQLRLTCREGWWIGSSSSIAVDGWILGCVRGVRWLPVFLQLLSGHTLGLQCAAASFSSAERENKEVLPPNAPGCCISSEPDQKRPELSPLLSPGISCDNCPRINMC